MFCDPITYSAAALYQNKREFRLFHERDFLPFQGPQHAHALLPFVDLAAQAICEICGRLNRSSLVSSKALEPRLVKGSFGATTHASHFDDQIRASLIVIDSGTFAPLFGLASRLAVAKITGFQGSTFTVRAIEGWDFYQNPVGILPCSADGTIDREAICIGLDIVLLLPFHEVAHMTTRCRDCAKCATSG